MTDETLELTRGLPPYFPSGEHSRNYDLLKPVGEKVSELGGDIEALDSESKVQTATSIPSLFELAKLVDLPPKKDESREQYRSRIISAYQLNTSRGTAEDIITTAATILNISPNDITFQPAEQPGVSIISVPSNGLQSLNIDVSDFVDILQQNTAAGYRVETIELGTLTFINPEEYNADDHEPGFGYDGLGDDGNPLGEGGTYAGALR